MKSLNSENVTLNSWIVTLALCFYFINGVIGINGISVVVAAVIWLLSAASLLRGTYKVYTRHFYIFLLLVLFFLISLVIVPKTTYTSQYLLSFLAFDTVAFFAGCQKIDTKKTITLTTYIGLIGLLILMYRGVENENAGFEMGMSYAILGILFASIIYILLNKKRRIIAYANIVISVILLIPIAPRGVMLSATIFLYIVAFNIITKGQDRGRKLLLKVVILSVTTLCGILAINNLEQIMTWLNEKLTEVFGLHVYAIEKYLFFFNRNNLSNGRDDIYTTIYPIIINNVGMGRGVGYLETIIDGSYAHNILLQVICEFGIIILIPCVYMLLKSLKMILFDRFDSKENFYIFMFLFCYGVIMLFYSSVYWAWVPFWVFIGRFLSIAKRESENVKFYS